MAIWNRNRSKNVLQEAVNAQQLDISNLSNLPYFQFASQLTMLRGQDRMGMNASVKSAMLNDPIISMIINMWISDSLSKDVISGKIFDVDIVAKDEKKEKFVQELIENIDYLIENSNLHEVLVQILYSVITTGISSVKLGFIDMQEDTRIKLFESNKRKYKGVNLDGNSKLLEAPDFDSYEKLTFGDKSRSRTVTRVNGRYYFELLPQKIVPLKHKGITVLYIDLDNRDKVLNPKNITTFLNTRGNVKTLSLKAQPDDIISELYEVPLGKSFIEHAVTPWSMLNTTQDCTVLALMTRASIYRIFQIDVGALSNKDTEKLVQEFKTRITTRETINVRAEHYSSAQTQLPLGDSIFVPTRNGLGNISVQAIGGDLDIKTQVPLDYFREDLLASLGVAKSLVYGDESGTLINTSATRQDIRYLRTVQQFTAILSEGLESIFKDYLKMIGVDLSTITLKVNFAQLNSEDALNRLEYEQAKQDALDKTIASLENLGINFDDGKYKKTRDELITRFLDADLLAIINEDEKNMPIDIPDVPDTDDGGSDAGSSGGTDFSNPQGPGIDSTPSGDFDDFDVEDNFDGGVPAVGDDTPSVEPLDTDAGEEPPYSIG